MAEVEQRRVARRAEAKFAGGLIGNESAFSSGDYNFDPLGLADKCENFLPWFREAELKHGRICMLAWLGRFPDTRRVLIHINNTNPILDPDSPERATVERAGVEVAFDGMEIPL